jgi:hypothetical protein
MGKLHLTNALCLASIARVPASNREIEIGAKKRADYPRSKTCLTTLPTLKYYLCADYRSPAW